jgi:hypothetical protein
MITLKDWYSNKSRLLTSTEPYRHLLFHDLGATNPRRLVDIVAE